MRPKRNSSSSTSSRSPSRSALMSSASTDSSSIASTRSRGCDQRARTRLAEQVGGLAADLAVEELGQERGPGLPGARRVGQDPAQHRRAVEQQHDGVEVLGQGHHGRTGGLREPVQALAGLR
ncbi:hypothetical protein ACU686_29905 [Yinghuangia aomiensis]